MDRLTSYSVVFDVPTHSLYVEKLRHVQDGANISILVEKTCKKMQGYRKGRK